MKQYRTVFDLHCDTLTECWKQGIGLDSDVLHFSIDKIPPDLRICQAAAVFMPDEYRGRQAWDYFLQVYDVFLQQLNQHRSRIDRMGRICDLTDQLQQKPVVLMLTVEGGSVIGGNPDLLDDLWNYGVRMMTLTWNAENELCGGVGSDAGFTSAGKRTVRRMEKLGMAVDVSHLNDRSFYELLEFAERPFAASHSNARAVCANRRNLTDEMFLEIVRRGGLVGLNYYDAFIRDGAGSESVSDLLRHLHHFLDLGGENTVALGSDFDGADMPPYLSGVDCLDSLIDAVERSGVPERVLNRLLYENAVQFFQTLEQAGVN